MSAGVCPGGVPGCDCRRFSPIEVLSLVLLVVVLSTTAEP
jgi:hypothetical protein